MADTKQKTVLVVEDEVSVSNVLQHKLVQSGYSTVVTEDGEEALKYMADHNPDIILLDVVMPKMNGFDFLDHLRAIGKDKTPVIIISNLEGENDRVTGKNLGIAEYIVKSNISLRDLIATVNGLLK